MQLEKRKINFLGDSITFGSFAATPETSYVGRFQTKYADSTIRRYGVGGSSIANQNVFRCPSLIDRVETMDPDADLVVVFGGTNDWGACVPLGTPEDRTADTFYGACYVLFEMLLYRYPGKPVAVVTPLHRLYENESTYQERKLAAPLKAYVQILKEVAEYFAFPVVDMYATSGLQPAVDLIRERFMEDGIHPNDAGHEILFNKMEAALRQL